MTVVLDTNVFLSALISPGNCREILKKWSQGLFKIVMSREILQEISAVGQRPIFRKYFSVEQLITLLKFISDNCIFIETHDDNKYKKFTTDAKDMIIVAAGESAGADFLVTGNVKHFKPLGKTKIVSPAEFLKLLA